MAGILGVARQTIDLWEGTSIANPSNTCNPPDLRIKIPKKEKQRIKEVDIIVIVRPTARA